MLYDKVGNCMNENQMNMQNNLNNQPVNPNGGVPPMTTMNNNFSASPEVPTTGTPMQQPVNNINMGVVPNPQNVGGVNINPTMPTPPTNNFMEDFSQAVVPEPVAPTVNVPPVMPEQVTAVPTPEPTMETPVQQQPQVMPTQTVEVPVASAPEVSVVPQEQQVVPTENISEVQSTTTQEEKPKKKKKGNWAFIIALFAIVGFFVLLLPLLVRIFGY